MGRARGLHMSAAHVLLLPLAAALYDPRLQPQCLLRSIESGACAPMAMLGHESNVSVVVVGSSSSLNGLGL